MRMQNYSRYKIFCAVARNLSMKKAAHDLYLTTSAISHSIKNLEKAIGQELFRREGNRLILTIAGKNLFLELEPLFKRIDEIDSRLLGKGHARRQVLKIATVHTFLNEFILPNAGWLESSFPKVSFQFETGSLAEAKEKVRTGEAQFGLVLIDSGDNQEFEIFPLLEIREIFVSKDQQFQTHNPIDLLRVASFPLISLHSDSESFAFYQRHFAKYHANLEPKIEVRQMDIICKLLKTTSAVGIVYDFLYKRLKNEDRSFEELVLERPFPSRTLAFIQNKNDSLNFLNTEKVNAFKKLLIAKAKP